MEILLRLINCLDVPSVNVTMNKSVRCWEMGSRKKQFDVWLVLDTIGQ